MLTENAPADLRDAFARAASGITDENAAAFARSVRARPRTGRGVAAAVVAGAAGVAVLGGVVLAGAAGRPAGAPVSVARQPAATSPGGARIELAGLTIGLPAGFTPTSASCVPAPSGPYIAVRSAAFASAPGGGCIEAALVPASAVASADRTVAVGSRTGRVSVDGAVVRLYVPVPGPDLRYLLLAGQGIGESELIAIAVNGFPATG